MQRRTEYKLLYCSLLQDCPTNTRTLCYLILSIMQVHTLGFLINASMGWMEPFCSLMQDKEGQWGRGLSGFDGSVFKLWFNRRSIVKEKKIVSSGWACVQCFPLCYVEKEEWNFMWIKNQCSPNTWTNGHW